MTKEQKEQLGKLLDLYQSDLLVWWKVEDTEGDSEKAQYYQRLVYSIDTIRESLKEDLELEEW